MKHNIVMTKEETITAKQANRALLNITVIRAKKISLSKLVKSIV
jgi:hypothetical protein